MGDKLTVHYAGQIATEPSMQYTSSGKAVCNFTVASNRKWGEHDEVTWVRCTVWGDKAENVNQWCQKGTKIAFTGNLKPDMETGGPRVWYDKNSQEPRASYEVNVYDIVFISDMRPKDSQGDRPYADLDEPAGTTASEPYVPGFD